MRNEVIFDNLGIPDIMVAFTPDELGLQTELKGKKVSEYMIGKYAATMINGVPHSLPLMKPAVGVDHDEAIRLCEAKGAGWHLTTNDEWAALALQSFKNKTMPRGNTNNGKSHSHPDEAGTTYENSYGKTLTGSGPVTWNHDHTAEGVADMCGNVWEHVGGIRFLNGQVQVIPNNEAAAGADQSKESKAWQGIYTPDGDPIYFNPHDGEIVAEPTEATEKDYDGAPFTKLEARALDVPDKLIQLGLYPPASYDGSDWFYVDNDAERSVYRGGGWYSGASAGVFYLAGSHSRAYSNSYLGFRPAFVRYSGDSDTLENLDDNATDLSNAPEEIKKQIKANSEKLKAREAFAIPKTLPEIVRYAMAYGLANAYEAAGGKDRAAFLGIAQKAKNKELKEAAALAPALAQVGAAMKVLESVAEPLRQAMENSLKETGGADNE